MSFHSLTDFLDPINIYMLSDDEGYRDVQMGKHIAVYDKDGFPDISNADIVLVGCSETRGAGAQIKASAAPDEIRKAFYGLYHWHKDVSVADVGNVKIGASMQDTYAALSSVTAELIQAGKRVVILGGSHDLTRAQYNAYVSLQKLVELSCVDSRIDVDADSVLPADNFLIDLLTSEPNFAKHYNHIGFQSYLVHPTMLESIDKLRFDCFRVGNVKEKLDEMEPVIRNSQLFSFDIAAIQHSHAPANLITPNGFNGEEACTLMQYAGMSHNVSSIGIYGYIPSQDSHTLTAKQISHMLWYLMDGMYKGKYESPMSDTNNFFEFSLAFAEMESTFLQSKKTGRWWMRLPNKKYIACSHNDYLIAANNEIPERWMRAVERM